ncbi:zinc finger protein Dzip1 [Austrofundulus limnaeus]|uniref:Zinc finger protein Dzip1 n=1 Tax=Austrofundulus limnaeus TaxID=52670 RepID=A0A2I4BEN4_AUSLI|nr:PREDICTED: zinc finger protein Dzip1-like [Austrofundulus limnaeus]
MVSEEDEDDWSDVSELQEIEPKQLQAFKDQNGNINKKNSEKDTRIMELGRKLEKQFTERVVKKPAGGVSVVPERRDQVQELSVRNLDLKRQLRFKCFRLCQQVTDLEDSSDSVASLSEDKQEVSKPTSGPLRRSLDSPSTSVWGTSTGKGHSIGLTEAGTGSTLKSSLVSFSDSDDSSNKHR